MVNTYKKGYRNEIRAKKFLEEQGWTVHRAGIKRFGDNDLFNLFDLVCVGKDRSTLWVQVKSNYIPPTIKREIREFAQKNFALTENLALIMAWMDRKNWVFEPINFSELKTILKN